LAEGPAESALGTCRFASGPEGVKETREQTFASLIAGSACPGVQHQRLAFAFALGAVPGSCGKLLTTTSLPSASKYL